MAADRRRRALAALGFALLLICARWQLGGFADFSAAQDIEHFDEGQYLSVGVHTHALKGLNPQWAPPYCLWYRMLFRVTGDTLTAYHLNAYLLAIAFPAVWYLACLALRARVWWALASALMWLISSANLETLRVGNFAAWIVLGGLTLASIGRSTAWSWWIAQSALWLAAFVRPELTLPAILVFLAGAWSTWRAGASRAALAGWLSAAILPALVLSLAFGVPLGAGRSDAAFQQHLAGNILEWHHLPFANWAHYRDVIPQYYALPTSPFDFLRHEPLAFAHHVGSNLWRLLTESIGAALKPPQSLLEASTGLAYAPLVATLIGGLLGLRRRGLSLTPASVVLGACGLFVLVSCAVIYPRVHYLPLLLCGILLLLAPREDTPGGWGEAIAVLAIPAMFALLPRYVEANVALPRPHEETVRALRALDLPAIRIFEDTGLLQFYLGVPVKQFGLHDLAPPFDAFLRAHDVNVVVLSPAMDVDPVLAPDPAWRRFVEDPAALGFQCREVIRADRRLCVR